MCYKLLLVIVKGEWKVSQNLSCKEAYITPKKNGGWGEERPSSVVWQFQAGNLEALLLIQEFNFKQVLLSVLFGAWEDLTSCLLQGKACATFPDAWRWQLPIPCGQRKRLELGELVRRGRRPGAQGPSVGFQCWVTHELQACCCR